MMSFLRMLICVAAVLAFGAGTLRAEAFTPTGLAADAPVVPAYTPVCPKTSSAATEQNGGTSTKMRLAGACRCCGWQNWGGHNVCVHQCCD